MAKKIDADHQRFRRIVKGRIKRELKKYMSTGELIGRQGKKMVTIPLPYIEIPRFKFGPREQPGVGQGDGEPGDPLGGDEEAEGQAEAGNLPGEHALEVDVTLEELAQILGEELELPDIQPKGKAVIKNLKDRYTGIRTTGPESLRHFKRTYKHALKRMIVSGAYDPRDPMVVPVKEDKHYRSWKITEEPENNAVVIYMMDVSGSMGEEQKEIVRIESFWIDTWLQYQYKDIQTRFIIHDATAREVDRETFFRTRESGGTIISSAYKLCLQLIEKDYPPDEWNIYPFHFSDGDNWSGDDTNLCIDLIKDKFFPIVNVFCYGQVESQYGSGQFIKDLDGKLTGEEKLITSRIENREAIYRSIKDFLGKGK
ncbi:MAG: hypothetical protein A2284_12015 [Deltaproteobacteria bacterium RIFOXYA12_FULL_61_11]|nr:MAG: hypothetical protein A2284_12015 [Deltaproteobacteria bacterium RIFOXYA12_FULL_61_11]